MPADPNPASAPGLYDGLVYVGGLIGAVLLGIAGYMRKPRPPTLATVAGAIVDNAALQPLLQRFDTLIGRLDILIATLTRDVELRESEAEEEAQQERIDRAIEKAIERLMRDNPPAPMPPLRAT